MIHLHADVQARFQAALDALVTNSEGDYYVLAAIVYGSLARREAWVKSERIRIGTLVTPLPRRRPRKLAREPVSLDHPLAFRLESAGKLAAERYARADSARTAEDPVIERRAAKVEPAARPELGVSRPEALNAGRFVLGVL